MAVVQTLIGNIKGVKGDTGAQGQQGIQGEAATIEVGSDILYSALTPAARSS